MENETIKTKKTKSGNLYRTGQKSFSMYFPDSLYKVLKAMCKKQGIPMKTYIIKSVIRNLNMEKKEKLKIVDKKCLHV